MLAGEGLTYGLKRFFRPGFIVASVQPHPDYWYGEDEDEE